MFWTLITVLVVLTVLCHLAMIKWLPRSQRFWKATDYFWLTIAGLGFLSVTQKAREEHYRDSKKFVESARDTLLKWGKHDALMSASNWRELSDSTEKAIGKNPAEELNESLQRQRQAADWYKNLAGVLSGGNPPGGWRKRLEETTDLLPTDSAEIRSGKQRFREQFTTLLEYDDLAVFYNQELRPTSGESNWLEWGPLLLVLAISVRLTKVSAEVFGYDRPPATPIT